MKNFFLLLTISMLLTGVAVGANGPIDKGSSMLGGSVYFTTQSGDLYEDSRGDSRTTIAFSPSVGYFVLPGLFLGLDFNLYQSKQGDLNKTTGYRLGPSIGFYYNTNPNRQQARGAVYPYVKTFFSIGRTTIDDWYYYWDGDQTVIEIFETTTDQTIFGGEAGALFMVSNAVGVNFGVSAYSTTSEWKNDTSIELTDKESGLTVWFGAGVTYFVY